jgi:hypothetical protein
MTDRELLDDVRRLRSAGATPKAIARTLGLAPAVVAPLVRRVATETPPTPPEHGDLVGCWISPAWSRDLIVALREGWDDVDLGPDGPAGMAVVVVARRGRGNEIAACTYLVDMFCLGVKNTIGPERLHRRDLPGLLSLHFAAFPARPLRVPLDLAQHLVHGAVAYAAGLGLDPHPDFANVRSYLGELSEPYAITFGRRGQPVYVAGPHDDARAIVRTLEAAVGGDGFAVAA